MDRPCRWSLGALAWAVMDRRTFLRALGMTTGVVGAGAFATACSNGQGGIPAGEPGISVGIGSFETLVGDERRVNLVVTENDLTPIVDASVEVYLRTLEGEVRSGPHPTTYYPEIGEGTGSGLGIYQAALPLTEPGVVELVAVEGDRYGVGALTVVAPESSQAPAPGQPAPATPTPTTAADQGVSPLCTETPPCPLHEVSLDSALAEGRPVMLLFATPQYCQTAACAPAVGNLVSVREGGDWGDLVFIHCEIYPNADAVGSSFVQAVVDWGLPTEPWLFAIASDGTISDRLDGPMLADDMRRLSEALV